MQALVLSGIKQPLQLEEVPDPTIGPDQVRVALAAAAFNRRDFWISLGMYPGLSFPTILGSDGCGTAEGQEVIINPNIAWGPNPAVPGKEYRILGMPDQGTFAQQIVVDRDRLIAKPAHLSIEEAAALPLGGLTAFRALFGKGQASAGQKVLITGIGGGVALFALQFAVATGCEVYVTSSSHGKIARAKELGAVGGANYREEGWSNQLRAQARSFDVIIDSAGGAGFGDLVKVVARGGRIVFFGATAGHWTKVDAPRLFLKQVSLLGSTMGSDQEFEQMVDFVHRHQIVPVVDEVFDLAEGQKGLMKMKESSQFGKLVMQIQ